MKTNYNLKEIEYTILLSVDYIPSLKIKRDNVKNQCFIDGYLSAVNTVLKLFHLEDN